jgi:hypothetical protein
MTQKNQESFESKQQRQIEEYKIEVENKKRIMELERADNDKYPLSSLEQIPDVLDEKQYDDACKNLNVDKFENVDCYEVEHLDVSAPEYSNKTVIKFALANRHLEYLQNKIESIRNSEKRDYPAGKKLGCGCIIYYKNHELTAIGSTCTDCYDKMIH